MPFMNASAEVLSHIQDDHDRRTLAKLMQRHEVLRIRLATQSTGNSADQEIIRSLRRQVAEWNSFGQRAQDEAQRLIDRNRELSARVAELEEQLREIVRKVSPHNRRLFQSGNRLGRVK